MDRKQDTREILDNLIYPRLTADIVFADLKGLKKEKTGISATCPACNRPSHFFCYYNGKYGKCHAGSCEAGQKAISWWDHTARRFGLTAKKDILHKLADMAGVHLPDTQRPQKPTTEKVETVEEAMKVIHHYGQKSALGMPDGYRKYLEEKRGFDLDMVRKSGMIYFEREQFLKMLFRKGVAKEILSQTGIFTKGFGEQYRILLPYPDENGGLYGFVGRLNYDLQPNEDDQPKYKNGVGTKKDVPYLFSEANGAGKHRMVIVEGPFDALLINHKCQLNGTGAIALCGDKMGEQAMTAVNMAKPPVIVLALDDDKAGRMSTMTLIRAIRKRMFVVSNFGGYKDPGDLIAAKGPESFNSCLQAAIPAYQWMFRYMHDEIRAAGAGGRMEILSSVAPAFQSLTTLSDRKGFIEEARTTTLLNEKDVRAAVGA